MNPRKLVSALVVSSAAVVTASSASAGSWVLQSPLPAKWDLRDVCVVSPTTAFACGVDLALLKTSDGGETWTQTESVPRLPNQVNPPFWQLDFVDEMNGWVIGGGGPNSHYRTTDGGASWTPFAGPHLGSFYYLDFIDVDLGFMASNFGMWRTSDGADSWQEIWSSDDRVYSMDWLDANRGVLHGERDDIEGVYLTSDGGATWVRGAAGRFVEPTFLSETVLLALRLSQALRSEDGGFTWTVALDDPAPTGFIEEAIEVIDSDSVAILGNDLRMWVSDDTGLTFTRTQEALGQWGVWWGLSILPSGEGMAAGRNGLIYRTTDGGHAWTQISHGLGFLSPRDMVMRSNGVGITVGQDGLLLRTTDFGRQWLARRMTDESGIGPHLNAVEAITDEVFVAAGHGGTFLYSTDAGVSWEPRGQPDLFRHDFHAVTFLDAMNGFVYGRAWNSAWGIIFGTTDGGHTWTRLTESSSHDVLNDAQMIDAQTGWAIGASDQIIITSDGWQTFTPRFVSIMNVMQSLAFASADVGWVGDNGGLLAKTTLGGFIWEQQVLPGLGQDDYIADMHALDEQTLIVSTGSLGYVYRTDDGGATWQRFDPGYRGYPDAQPTTMSVLPTGETWIAGFAGVILASDPPQPGDPADINGDGVVSFADLLILLAEWGDCPDPPADCPADIDGDGRVTFSDLVILLASWT